MLACLQLGSSLQSGRYYRVDIRTFACRRQPLDIFVLKMLDMDRMASAGYGGYQELWSCHDNNNQQTLSRSRQ